MSATPTAADRARAQDWLERESALTYAATYDPQHMAHDVATLALMIAETVAHERERAATVCEERRALPVYERATFEDGCTVCAAAIRAGEGA